MSSSSSSHIQHSKDSAWLEELEQGGERSPPAPPNLGSPRPPPQPRRRKASAPKRLPPENDEGDESDNEWIPSRTRRTAAAAVSRRRLAADAKVLYYRNNSHPTKDNNHNKKHRNPVLQQEPEEEEPEEEEEENPPEEGRRSHSRNSERCSRNQEEVEARVRNRNDEPMVADRTVSPSSTFQSLVSSRKNPPRTTRRPLRFEQDEEEDNDKEEEEEEEEEEDTRSTSSPNDNDPEELEGDEEATQNDDETSPDNAETPCPYTWIQLGHEYMVAYGPRNNLLHAARILRGPYAAARKQWVVDISWVGSCWTEEETKCCTLVMNPNAPRRLGTRRAPPQRLRRFCRRRRRTSPRHASFSNLESSKRQRQRYSSPVSRRNARGDNPGGAPPVVRAAAIVSPTPNRTRTTAEDEDDEEVLVCDTVVAHRQSPLIGLELNLDQLECVDDNCSEMDAVNGGGLPEREVVGPEERTVTPERRVTQEDKPNQESDREGEEEDSHEDEAFQTALTALLHMSIRVDRAKRALREVGPPYSIQEAVHKIQNEQGNRGRFQVTIGMKIRKPFNGQYYNGTVQKKIRGKVLNEDDTLVRMWKIQYEDGDIEDMEWEEIIKFADSPPRECLGRKMGCLELFCGKMIDEDVAPSLALLAAKT